MITAEEARTESEKNSNRYGEEILKKIERSIRSRCREGGFNLTVLKSEIHGYETWIKHELLKQGFTVEDDSDDLVFYVFWGY